MMSFTFRQREQISKRLASEHFDLFIIGGGITGAGIALDASLRGLRAALIEKNDFAFGTSSRSTKLIHGGLRYLKQLEFGLVKEVGSERAIVHKLAPHLVIPEKMLLPLKEGRGFGTLLTSFGLKLYDWLAGVKQIDQRKMLTRQQTLACEPLLKPDGVKGGGLYAEYRTDDARLTLEIMKTAAHNGATVINYVQALRFLYDDKKIARGVEALDVTNGHSFEIKATAIVNATGPWVDELRMLDNSRKGKQLHLTKGVHLVVPRKRLPIKQAIYFDVPDGRMIFAIPRGFTTYIGTTDTDYRDAIDWVSTSHEDADYLLDAVNEAFPSVNLTRSDVLSSWAGLRPLIHEEGKSASELSRKDEIFESASGLLSIAGGKLTGYRKMAERVVDMVIEKYYSSRTLKPCSTDQLAFTGGPFANADAVKRYTEQLASQLRPLQLEQYADYLVHTYGKQSDEILRYMDKLQDESPAMCLVKAELYFTVDHEMVLTALDFFNRRTGMLYFDIHRAIEHREMVLNELKRVFSWDDDRMQRERIALEQAITSATLNH
ncbi:MAG: glycerol-3-phosphate dehydrogenase/oxidase [Cyclobacteriaceae bacterium]|nr:glycerol-3-phosphate dehydrogenase/oxidase [Cyclobacteriaceae bacterium]